MSQVNRILHGIGASADTSAISDTAESRSFQYAIAQYVHQRREERLNIGVVVYDREERRFRLRTDPKVVSTRVLRLFPEVDRKGLEFYLTDLTLSINHSSPAFEEPFPLDAMVARWSNVIQFSDVRSFPATSLANAAERLANRFVDLAPRSREKAIGIARATQRTREAIREVFPEEDMRGVSAIRIPRTFVRNGKERHLPDMLFPFLIGSRVLVDTLSFEGKQPAEAEREATEFIEKARWLERAGSEYVLTASVALDPLRPEDGTTQMEHILYETKLDDRAVVDAEHARDALLFARAQLAA
jgi:Protein of unknown function (DUF3037)